MTENPTVRVFVSSPSDVRPERLIVERVVKRLAREFSYHFRVEAVLWEREPLLATHHFQDLIVPPRETDIVVTVLWSRLGVPLPEARYRGAISKAPVTGTEWEFEDAAAGYQQRGLPELLLYRKRARVTVELGDRAVLEEQQHQSELVEEFMRHWFRSLDGKSFIAASREFADATEFESLLEEHLRALLRKRLTGPEDIETPVSVTWHQGSPYRGLESFEIEHAPIFFGRMRARNEVREILARQIEHGCGFVLVTGASGSGKSSLVKAGVLPDLLLPGMIGRVALCRYLVTRPAATGAEAPKDVLAALAQALFADTALPELAQAPLEYTAERLRELFDEAPSHAAQPIRQGLSAAGQKARLTERGEARLVLVVDQLEELFTADITPKTGERYVAALAALARSGLVWVIATMRSDFFGRIPALPSLAALSAGEGTYLLAPPDAADIGQIIRRPAREAGLRFETDERAGHSLDEVILEAAAKDPASLPLLEYLLDQLWQRRNDMGFLTFEAYDALKGLEGAIGERAEQVLTSLPETVQAAFPSVLRSLVTVGSGVSGVATARDVPLSGFPPGCPERQLVESMVNPAARILVVGGEGSEPRLRIAHEAMLTHWPRARRQIEDDARELRARARLEEAAARWRSAEPADRDSLLLPRGLPLSEGEALIAKRRSELDPFLVNYVEASSRAEQANARRRRRQIGSVSAAGAALILIAFGAAFRFYEERGVADSNRLAMTAVSQLNIDPQLSLVLAKEAMKTAPSAVAIGALRRALSQPRELATLEGLTISAALAGNSAEYSPDGRQVATISGAGRVQFWDIEAEGRLGSDIETKSLSDAIEHHGTLTWFAFNRDSTLLATAGGTKDKPGAQTASTVEVWNVSSRTLLASLDLPNDVHAADFSPDGNRLAIVGGNCSLIVWSWKDNGKVAYPAGGCRAAGEPESRKVQEFGQRGRCNSNPSWGGQGSLREVFSVAFFSDGKHVVTGNGDCLVRVWDIDSGELKILAGHSAEVTKLVFSPDGNHLLTASGLPGGGFDSVARLWDVQDWQSKPLQVGYDRVYGTAFSPDSRFVATSGGGLGSPIWVYEVGTGTLWAELRGHTHWVMSTAFSPTNSRLLLTTGSDDGTARVWDIGAQRDQGREFFVFRHSAYVDTAKFSPNGNVALTTDSNGKAHLWPIDLGLPVPTEQRPPGSLGLHLGQTATGPGKHFTISIKRDEIEVHDNDRDGEVNRLRTFAQEAAFSHDGRLVVTAEGDSNKARVWDLATGAEMAVLRGISGSVPSAEFDPSDQLVVTASADGTASLWDITTAEKIAQFGGNFQPLAGARFDPEHKAVITWTQQGKTLSHPCDGCGAVDELLPLAAERSKHRSLTSEERGRFLKGD